MSAEKCYIAAELKAFSQLKNRKLWTIPFFPDVVLQVKHRYYDSLQYLEFLSIPSPLGEALIDNRESPKLKPLLKLNH